MAHPSETGDRFGYAVDAADIDGDGIGDLIIGIPDEDIGSISNSGLIQIRFNPDEHSDTTPSVQSLHQGSTGVEGSLEAGDRFGAFVHAADVTGDGTDDVIVGIPNESIGSDNNAGAVSNSSTEPPASSTSTQTNYSTPTSPPSKEQPKQTHDSVAASSP